MSGALNASAPRLNRPVNSTAFALEAQPNANGTIGLPLNRQVRVHVIKKCTFASGYQPFMC